MENITKDRYNQIIINSNYATEVLTKKELDIIVKNEILPENLTEDEMGILFDLPAKYKTHPLSKKFLETKDGKLECTKLCQLYDKQRFYNVKYNAKGEPIFDKPYMKVIADALYECYDFRYFNQSLHVFSDGYYQNQNAKNIVLYEIANLIGVDVTTYRNNEIMNHLKQISSFPDELVNTSKTLVNFKNGMLDLTTMELLPHDPKHMSTVCINCDYNPSARCPTIEKFLDDAIEVKFHTSILQAISLCLIPYPPSHYTLLQGQGGNGKSVIIELIEEMLGKNNYSNIDIKTLTNDKFAASGLYGKRANLSGDISTSVGDETIIKKITGGDTIHADVKYKSPFGFKNMAQMFFSCNTLPNIKNIGIADFDRMNIILFRKRFRGTDLQIPNFSKFITTEEEKSGLINLLIPQLKEFLKKGRIEKPFSKDELEDLYFGNAQNVESFFEDCVERAGEGHSIGRENAYRIYEAYCEYYTVSPRVKRSFSGLMKKHNYSGISKGRMEKRTWKEVIISLPTKIINFMFENGKLEKNTSDYYLFTGNSNLAEYEADKLKRAEQQTINSNLVESTLSC